MDGPLSSSASSVLFDRILASQTDREASTTWAVVTRTNGEWIGQAFLTRSDNKNREAELGFLLDAGSWGHGFATEVAARLIQYGLMEAGLSRVFATVDIAHAASVRVLEKSGMSWESTPVDDDGPYHVYAASRDE